MDSGNLGPAGSIGRRLLLKEPAEHCWVLRYVPRYPDVGNHSVKAPLNRSALVGSASGLKIARTRTNFKIIPTVWNRTHAKVLVGQYGTGGGHDVACPHRDYACCGDRI